MQPLPPEEDSHPYAASRGAVIGAFVAVVVAGLSADRYTIPADATTVAACHYAGPEAGAVWHVNGLERRFPMRADGTSAIDVVADAPGLIDVECNGVTITLEAQ